MIRNLSYADFSDKINLPFGLSINKDNFVSLTQQPNKPNKRNLVIDFYLYDVMTEELIDKRHFTYLLESEMAKPDYAIEFASAEFFASDYGQLFDKMLNEEVLAITTTLSCRPYTLRVIDKDKKNIYLNVGSQSRVKTGDILTMYRADIEAGSFDTDGQRKQFGWPQSQLRITKVFPAYSIAVSNNEEVVHLEKNKEYLLVW
ncbi:MAG: hypothetical protein KAI17_26740 [Thiotrichaceae bacterium]|nr:hypothetical protein [Thiotrichaceae bacterium]